MSKKIPNLTAQLQEFIKKQKIFFVGTAVESGHVNVSPKGMATFYILNAGEVLWLNMTGSGNETAAHVLKDPRMTVMFCSFEKNPLILRLYGNAEVFHERDSKYSEYKSHFEETVGARQIFKLTIDLVQTSCGFGVPFMDYKGERETLKVWSEQKGESGIKEYWTEKNQVSLDGLETGIFE